MPTLIRSKPKANLLAKLFTGPGHRLDRFSAHDAVLAGIPFSAVDEFARETGFSKPQIASLLGLPYSTLARREREGFLKPSESAHLVRAMSVFRASVDFQAGDKESGLRWMTKKNPFLGDRTPLECAATEHGVYELEAYIFKVENGVVV